MRALDATPELSDDEPGAAPVAEIEVRRNGVLFAVVGLVCLALALAYVVRGLGGASAGATVLTWVMALVIAGIGVVMGLSWRESRTPMVLADAFGIRIRLGHEWRGLPWSALEQVVVEPRTSLLHDGRLVVVPRDPDEALAGLDARARRQVALSHKVYGAALVVPLGITTRVSVPRLVDALAQLAGSRAAVVELAGWAPQPVVPLDEGQRERRAARSRRGEGPGGAGGSVAESRFERDGRPFEGLAVFEDLASSVSSGVHAIGSTVGSVGAGVGAGVTSLISRLELRDLRRGPGRTDADLTTTHFDGSAALALDPVDPVEDIEDAPHLEYTEHTEDAEDTWDTREPDAEPVTQADPEIGPRLRSAREQLGYDVAALCERTRIQPHVVEAIERDDFDVCGGDFYARGHLRTLCSVLGVPAAEVVAAFDARFASAPVDAKRVFGAELATGRAREGAGRRWAVVLGALLVLVLAWGVARLFTDEPQTLSTPALGGSAGLASQRAPITSIYGPPVTMSVRGLGAPSSVVVRDHTGAVMWTGTLQAGGRKQLAGVGPFEVTAGDPDNVEVWVDGKDRGTVVSDNAIIGKQTRTFD